MLLRQLPPFAHGVNAHTSAAVVAMLVVLKTSVDGTAVDAGGGEGAELASVLDWESIKSAPNHTQPNNAKRVTAKMQNAMEIRRKLKLRSPAACFTRMLLSDQSDSRSGSDPSNEALTLNL